MKLLMLYGVNCTKEVWDYLKPYMQEFDIDYVVYPHEVTLEAQTVDTLTKWVYDNYQHTYDAVIGHSLGGIIALQLVANYKIKTKKVITLDTNFKPANIFYRNLMLQDNLEKYGEFLSLMFNNERKYYHPKLLESIQNNYDYTDLISNIDQDIYALYGDRGFPEYQNKISDLNLSKCALERLKIKFIKDSCHMIMIEKPKLLSEALKELL